MCEIKFDTYSPHYRFLIALIINIGISYFKISAHNILTKADVLFNLSIIMVSDY